VSAFWVLAAIGFASTVGLSSATAANAEEIKVMSDGPLAAPLRQIADMFGPEQGHRISFVFGTSPAIEKRIASGETADVLLIQPNFMMEMTKAGKVAPGERPIIGRVRIGIAIRSDLPAPDVSSVDSLRRALLAADAVIFNNVASGNYFATVLDKLGIAETVKPKVARAAPDDVFNRILQSTGNDLAIGTIPQILGTKGLKLAGPLPAEYQAPILYVIAPMVAASQPAAAAAFIAFVGSEKAKSIFKAAGVD
jgi:molybdate transport system substrate-binding protein